MIPVVVIDVVTFLTGLLVAAALVVIWRGAREREAAQADDEGLTALWDYQRVLHGLGCEASTAVTGGSDRLNRIRRDELLDARRHASPYLYLLSRKVQWVLLDPTIADLADPRRELVDVAHAYLALAETLRADLDPGPTGPESASVLVTGPLHSRGP